MIPTTIAVAAVSPMERLSSVDMECVKAARFYHGPGINLLQPIFATANLCFDHSSLELSMPDNHRDAHHIVGNKGARLGSA
jgi:hypothetical protein